MENQMSAVTWRLARLVGLGVAGALLVSCPRPAFAQFGGGFSAPALQPPAGFGVAASQQLNNPAVSPSLLLTQPGINPAVAAQTLIQPQLQLGNAVLSNQQQIGALQNGLSQLSQPQATLSATPLLQTGHQTAFFNTFDYFPALSRNQGRR